MAVVLFLDLGNTGCKWRLVGDCREAGSIYHQGDWPRLIAELPLARAERLVVASVAGRERNARLAAALHNAAGIEVQFVMSEAQTLGVSNAYETPARLGVDRWLGVVEAFCRYGAAVVIDSGSALTIDAVDVDGQHLGGYIVPGLQLMHQSLRTGTADVHLSTPQFDALQPGRNSDAAVGHGVLRMSRAFVLDAVAMLRTRLNDDCRVLLTGGDASLLLPLLGKEVEYRADLVLDGLERVTSAADGVASA